MRNPMLEWWKLAMSAGEIAWYTPQVVQQRTARMLAAPTRNRASDRNEDARMVSEKLHAGQEAQRAFWEQSIAAQQRLWAGLWSAALAGQSPARTMKAAGRRSARDAAFIARHTLAPVRRRVKANAKRLRPRK